MACRVAAALVFAHLALAAAQVPTNCGKFRVADGGLEVCTMTLSQGTTYNISTLCSTVAGSPTLRLLDGGDEVAYNDGLPFCGPSLTPAALDYKVECDNPSTAYTLVIECFRKSSCSGDLLVAVSARVPPEDCGAPKPPPAPPPPVRPPPPPRPPTAQCSSFVPPTTYNAVPIVATPDNTFVYARTEDCPKSCGQHCEAGCFFCSDSGVLPGSVPDPSIPDTQFVAMSYSAEVDGCSAAFDGAGDLIYKTGSVITAPGLSACLSGFYRASSACDSPAACGTWTLRD